MTVKAGQKCTAIRRIIVPANKVEDVQIALENDWQKQPWRSLLKEFAWDHLPDWNKEKK